MLNRLLTAFFIAALLFLPALPALALSSDWQKDEAASVRLISAVDGVGQDKTVSLGLDVQLADGWHTYWRSPGMAGLPPDIDWKNSQTDDGNLDSANLLYPAPKRYTAYGLETVGYRDHVVFPIDVMLRAPGHALNIDTTVNLLVCSAICVPKTYQLKLNVPQGDAKESSEASLIKQYRDQLPGNADSSGLAVQSTVYDGQYLTIDIEARDAAQNPDVFIEDDKNISFAAPATTVESDNHGIRFKIKPADSLPDGTTLAGMPLTLTVVSGDHALEEKVKVPAATAAEPLPASAPVLSLWLVVVFAIIGGFILNLMPCVLPVLSLKILSVISHGGGSRHLVRQSFLITAAGILFSFLMLAAVTIGLKEFGMTLGWGVQFQQPIFLMGLVLLLTFFAANLWGLFEIPLPRFLADRVTGPYHPKLAGDFATGAFATLLATPCSAPFLGTAIGFALASGPGVILIIFAALGFGMTLPYLTIALFPRLAVMLPKPGMWMVRLRQILGLALALTAIWLVWVLAAQITVRFAIVVGFSLVAIIVLLSLRKRGISKRIIRFGLLDFILLVIALTLAGSLLPKGTPDIDRHWLPFSEATIAADVNEGKVVFVDVTADWCLTCKANKKFILAQDALSQRLFNSDIIAMQADWTNPDTAITAFLHKYGRYGIPFNAVFGPGAPQGIILPELLTPQVVNDALDKASKP